MQDTAQRTLLKISLLLVMIVLPLSAIISAAPAPPVAPFEIASELVPLNPIDTYVLKALNERDITPAHLCSDGVFIRRVYLDLTGTLPAAFAVKRFLDDKRPQKRAILIDMLLKQDEFCDYWALKWCDLLRVKAEFPINLWPNAVQAYHRWIRDALKSNMPYDQFARELLTASGSNFRTPQVNFYRAMQGHEPGTIAAAVALTFMGTRLETWDETARQNLEATFSRVAYKGTAEWKEEIVFNDPAPDKALKTFFPDGTRMVVPRGGDPRQVFANWLIKPDNPWFAKNLVNRAWYWFLGRGIIHEPDDIREENRPANPELLTYLEAQFVESKYDLRTLFRLILNSRTYQQSSIPQSDHAETEALSAVYIVRRLDAEVLVDALDGIFGAGESYSSPIPEPFTFIPRTNRTITLADGSISSQFLEMFGRPARDTGHESERNNRIDSAQCLHLLNSTHIQKKIESGWGLKRLLKTGGGGRRPGRLIQTLYMAILSRPATPEEVQIVADYVKKAGKNRRNAAVDICWALVNSKEFLYRH